MPRHLPRWALGIFLAFTLGRLALAPSYELMPQDAYYFLYADHLDWSYFDHPPLIGWLLWASTGLFGATSFGIRFGMLVTAVATQLLIFALARRLQPNLAAGTLVLLTSTGMATIVSLVATPDGPLLFGWALSMLLLHRALFNPGAGSGDWLAAGAAMGIAFLGKYTALFLPLGLFAFLAVSPTHRRRLSSVGPWLALVAMQVVSLPVYWWNWRHGFASFRFQAGERTARLSFDLDHLGGFLVSQLAMLLPVAFLLVLFGAGFALARRQGAALWSRGDEADQDLFLLAFFLPLFLFCVALSTLTWVKVNWPMPAYLAGFLLASQVLTRARLAWQLALSVLLHVAIAAELFYYPVPVLSHDTWFGWSAVARQLETRAAQQPDDFLFAIDSYKTTAEMLFYSELDVYGRNVVGCPALQLDHLGHDLEELVGHDALLIRNEPRLRPGEATEGMLDRVRLFFDEIHELPPIQVRDRDHVVRYVRLFEAIAYRGSEAAAEADRGRTDDPCRFTD